MMMYVSEIQSIGRSERSHRASVIAGRSRFRSVENEASGRIGFAAARYGIAALFFLVLFTGFMLMTSGASEQSPSPASVNEAVVTVASGDTLWGIAAEMKNEGMDTRRAVYAIKQRNGLTGSTLQSGQKLIIPAW